jgi:hypothetical protein
VLQNCALELAEQANKIKEYELEASEREDTITALN